MTEKTLLEDLKKLNVLILFRSDNCQATKNFLAEEKRKQAVGEMARYLNKMGLDAKDIAENTWRATYQRQNPLNSERRK